MKHLWILAQGAGEEASSEISSEPVTDQGEATTVVPSDANTATGKSAGRSPFGGYGYWLFLGLMLVMMYLILFRGPQKQKQQHRQMVQSLEKNDRVRTIGGIIGTVVAIKGDEITLKVDESNNTKLTIVSSAIGKNLSKDKS